MVNTLNGGVLGLSELTHSMSETSLNSLLNLQGASRKSKVSPETYSRLILGLFLVGWYFCSYPSMKTSASPNMRKIAEKSGVHYSTVSLALRGDPRISPETQRRVREVARKLNYRPNPLVSSLMAQVKASREVRYHGNLAYLHSSRRLYESCDHFKIEFDAISAHAEANGFNAEIHFIEHYLKKRGSLSDILKARGIEGVISDIVYPDIAVSDFDWSSFAWICIGHRQSLHFRIDACSESASPIAHNIPFVCSNHFSGMQMAFEYAVNAGYKRPGLCLTRNVEDLTEHQYSAAFQFFQNRFMSKQAIPAYIGEADEPEYLHWLKANKPDVLISHWGDFFEKSKDVGHKTAFINLDWVGGPEAGVMQNRHLIAEKAVDLLIDRIYKNERGSSTMHYNVIIDGQWVDADPGRLK